MVGGSVPVLAYGCPYCRLTLRAKHMKTLWSLHMMSHCDKGWTCVLCEDGDLTCDEWDVLLTHYKQMHQKVCVLILSACKRMYYSLLLSLFSRSLSVKWLN